MNKFLISPLLAMILCSGIATAKDYSMPLSNPGQPATIEAHIMKGSITVQGYDGTTVEISANPATKAVKKQDNFDDEMDVKAELEIKVQLDSVNGSSRKRRSTEGLQKVSNMSSQIEVVESDNKVEISSFNRKRGIDLVIRVPFNSNLELELNRGGDIKVVDVRGSLELGNHRGAISAEGVVGPIVAESHRQDIEVVFKSLNQDSPSSLTSHRGSIDVTVSNDFKAKVSVQTHRGEIYSGLDTPFSADNEVKTRKTEGSHHVTMGGLLSVDVNGGGQDLTLITYRGDIYVRK